MNRPVLFLAGPHASGKTELATHLVDSRGYSCVDLGPSIRAAHKAEQPDKDFGYWNSEGEKKFGPDFTNRVVANAALRSLESSSSEVPFIVSGSRSYPGLQYLINALDAENNRTMYVEADEGVMFERYKAREDKPDLTVVEFQAVLAKDQAMGLEGIRSHADWIVYNCGSLATFYSTATEHLSGWLDQQ